MSVFETLIKVLKLTSLYKKKQLVIVKTKIRIHIYNKISINRLFNQYPYDTGYKIFYIITLTFNLG